MILGVFAMSGLFINDDFLSIAGHFPEKSFDAILTSPPFKESDIPGDYWAFYDAVMGQIFRLASKVAIVIHTATKINDFIPRYPPKRVLVWGKGVINYSYRWNPIYVYQVSDDYKVNKYIYADTFGIKPVFGEWKVHRHQDPVGLYYALLKMFKGVKNVLDPFMGSGTTFLACEALGLDFTGVEIDADNFRNALDFVRSYKFDPNTFSVQKRFEDSLLTEVR